ncbi:hypothetical protein cje14_02608, partial [Campylobacter jejuni subsp. jejuni 53161]
FKCKFAEGSKAQTRKVFKKFPYQYFKHFILFWLN